MHSLESDFHLYIYLINLFLVAAPDIRHKKRRDSIISSYLIRIGSIFGPCEAKSYKVIIYMPRLKRVLYGDYLFALALAILYMRPGITNAPLHSSQHLSPSLNSGISIFPSWVFQTAPSGLWPKLPSGISLRQIQQNFDILNTS